MPAALPFLSAAFAVGILLAARFALPIAPLLLCGLAAAIASIILTTKKKPAAVGLLFLFACLGMLSHQWALQDIHGPWQGLLGEKLVMEGYIQEVLRVEDELYTFQFRVERVQGDSGDWLQTGGMARISVYAPGDAAQPAYGQRLQIQGIPTVPAGLRNPGGFDYAAYLESAATGAVVTVFGRDITLLPGRGGNLLLRTAYQLRERAKATITQYLPDREAGLALGLLLGDRQAVNPETVEAYRRLGIAHLMAVSGLHVGYVAVFALFLAGKLLRRGNPRLTALLAVLLVLGYVLLTGGRPPVWRAALTMLLAMFARQVGREGDGFQALAIAMLAMLSVRPLWLFSLSFQFSFLATAGILLLTPRIEPYLTRLPGRLRGLVAITVAAQLAVLPLQATHFGLFSFLALPANLVCVPLVGLVMALGMAAILAGFFHYWLAVPFLATLLPALAFLERMPLIPASWPAVTIQLPFVSPLVWLLYILALGAFIARVQLWPLSGRKIIALLLVINFLVFASLPTAGRGHLRVVFLDVGQGQSVHVQTPGGSNLLIDAGGRSGFDVGEQILMPYFRVNNIRKLDLLVLTHPHYDHYGGMKTVVENMKVGGFISSGEAEESEAFHALIDSLDEAAIPLYAVQEGYQILVDDVLLEVLSPPANLFRSTGDDSNNNSLVISLTYNGFSILFTGDAESEAIERLVRERSSDFGHQVLQVPHHGSRGALTAAFLSEAETKAAVIPVGKNMFGHPHPDTLTLLQTHGILVYRNDLHGAITVTSDGVKWTMQTQIK